MAIPVFGRLAAAAWRRSLLALGVMGAVVATAQEARADIDLHIVSYTASPTNIPITGPATFELLLRNNGPDASPTPRMTIAVPANVEITGAAGAAYPSFCGLAGAPGAQVLICDLTAMGDGESRTISYQAVGRTIGSTSGAAIASELDGGISDSDAANDSLAITPTVVTAADLTVAISASASSLPAGSPLSYTVTSANAGPQANGAGAVRLDVKLPATSDFRYAGYTGAGWACTHTGGSAPHLACVYSGAAMIGSYPDIVVNGAIIASVSGTLSASVSIESTNAGLPDPLLDNNAPPPVVVNVEPGSDLRAEKAMPDRVVLGAPPAIPESIIRLGIFNEGPQSTPAGATITDDIPANLTLGALPAGCSAVGRALTCTAGVIAAGARAVFDVPVSGAVLSVGTDYNSALAMPPAGFNDPDSGNNSASDSYNVVEPSSDLRPTKVKTPNPVHENEPITNQIALHNDGPVAAIYSPSEPLRFYDDLGEYETYETVSAGWSCTAMPSAPSGSRVSCVSTGSGSIPVGGSLALTLTTRAGDTVDADVTNKICVGSTAGSGHMPADTNGVNDCAYATSFATPYDADLAIVKEVSLSGAGGWVRAASPGAALAVSVTDDAFFVRLTVSNEAPTGGATARTVTVNDPILNFLNTTITQDSNVYSYVTVVENAGTMQPGDTCAIGAADPNIVCTLHNLAAEESRTIILKVNRPFEEGLATNTATVSSPDTTDAVASNNSSTSHIDVEGLADIALTAKSVNPSTLRVGGVAEYTISLRNVGPNAANGVVAVDDFPADRFDIIPGGYSTTKPGATCAILPGTNTLSCDMGAMDRGEARQIRVQVRPKYPFGSPAVPMPGTHTNIATVSTTSHEVAGQPAIDNNRIEFEAPIEAPILNLAVSKAEPPGPEYDPVAFETDPLVYDVRVTNSRESRATNVLIVDTPAPPAGYTMTLAAVQPLTVNPAGAAAQGGFTLRPAPNASCVEGGGVVTCRLDADPALNFLDPGQETILRLRFDQGPATPGAVPSGSLTFRNNVTVSSSETNDGYDPDMANNTAYQTTTVLPRTDLHVISKTLVSPDPIDLNAGADYEITFRNRGPSPTMRVRLIDTLPAGWTFVSATPVGVSTAGAASVTSNVCTGTTVVTCNLFGMFPVDDAGSPVDTVTLTIRARPVFPFTGVVGSSNTNTASIEVGRDDDGKPVSRDPNPSNNSQTEDTLLQVSSIAGRVYNDANRNNLIDTGEGISGVTLTLSGTDSFGNAISGVTTTTAADGTYIFENLPPGSYEIVETHPSGYIDGLETAGTGGGTVVTSTFGADAAQNTIWLITLGQNVAATGYVFQEYRTATLSGYIYRDLNNDGVRAGGAETGYASGAFSSSPHVRLTGVDFRGNAVNLTASVNGSGQYSFADLPPSDGAGYTVTQLAQPTGALDGRDANGAGAANVIPGSAGRAQASETIAAGVVDPGANLTERNFGELPPSSLAGAVYLDLDGDATRDAGETGRLAGATLRLTGTNDLGDAVDCSIVTTVSGVYSFPNAADADPLCRTLRPGAYTLAGTLSAGLEETGVYIGSAGGSAGAVTGANRPAPGVMSVAITIAANTAGVNYDFGARGSSLAGYVYIDVNNDGDRGAGEAGIPGVAVTLSGLTAAGQNVCTIVTCTTTTGADGSFSYPNLPGSNGVGYTLMQQSQTASPLTNWADGIDRAGSLGGSAGNDVISGIPLALGDAGVDYRFGERGASLAGLSYVDLDRDGVYDAGDDTLLGGVTFTLSGTTASGADVCAYLAALTPSRTCTTTSGAGGAWSFADLPAGSYAVTQTQPAAYGDGSTTAGSAGGTAGANVISGIALTTGGAATGYHFGDLPIDVSGRVYLDLDRDGVDDTEAGVSGVTIELLDSTSTVIATTTTDSTGAYTFKNLVAGTYTVRETQPPQYGSSTPNQVTITPAGGATPSIDFGETYASIAGAVYVDQNADGLRGGGEPGIGGVTITLTGTDINLASVNLTTTTASDGSFLFDTLLPGTYRLVETQPSAWDDGAESVGTAGGVLTAPDTIQSIALGAGVQAADYRFGELGQSISGRVYVDLDRDGVDDTEAGVSGVTVELRDATYAVVATTTTGADGSYVFSNFPAGSYTVSQTQPAGYGSSTPNDVAVSVPQGGFARADFGETVSTLSGAVYLDSDGNGLRGVGETIGIPGVTITLTGTNAASAPVSLTTTTGADGSWSFTGLLGGIYMIVETQPAAYGDSGETIGNRGGVNAPNDTISDVVITGGVDGAGYLFGELGQSISGRVYVDLDRDGVDDVEAGVGGVTITLRDNLGAVVATTTTGTDGSYSFPNLPAGSYTVEETQPAGYGSSTPNSVAVTLPPSGGTQAVNFGETLSTLSGFVFMDQDDDGAMDVGEAPIAGVSVRIVGTSPTSAGIDLTTTTLANGSFLFENLPEGLYELIETQPVAYADGRDTAGSAGGSAAVNDRITGINLAGGTDATGYLFGEQGLSVSGVVYVDRDRNGDYQGGDAPIPGVTVTLENSLGNVVATTTTGLDGSYSFPNLVGGDYVVVVTQPQGYGDGPENGSNRAPVRVAPGGPIPSVDFGETLGALSGSVYNDSNENGLRDAHELGLADVEIRLTGTDVNGAPVSLTTRTAADGSYRFDDLLGGDYTLSEAQPADFADGLERAGDAGGSTATNDVISVIALAPGQDAGGYLFGEVGARASVAGHVWFDADSDRRFDADEQGREGWIVELWRDGAIVASTTTGADGDYRFGDQLPGGGYSLRFRHPVSGLPAALAATNETGAQGADGVVSSANPGGATIVNGELTNFTLNPGANLLEQSLPLDPAGVVYDSMTRAPVAGATVEIIGPSGFDPALHLLGGAAAARQITDTDGAYQYWLAADAPAGEYRLLVTPPDAYSREPSTTIPACSGALTVGPGALPLVVQRPAGPPAQGAPASCTPGGETTAYWLAFVLTPGVSANVVHNHIPVDPILEGAIVITKTTPKTNVTRGDLVPYAITARNTTTGRIRPVEIVDRIPAGFAYKAGSATVNGVQVEPVRRGRDLVWGGLDFEPGSEASIQLVLVVGSGVREGDHTNQAFATQTVAGRTVSNIAEATVRLVPDPDFDCTDVIGKVFDDRNGNGYQDEGEPGLPGVRVATVNGLLITTDADGRYHIACAAVPHEDRGSNFVLKLDQRTLPQGYRMTTENPEVARLTRGKIAKINFGAAIFQTIRIDLDDRAFVGDDVSPALRASLAELVTTLEQKPSVVRFSYQPVGDTKDAAAKARLERAVDTLEAMWAEKEGRCRLIVETTLGVVRDGEATP